MERKTWVGEAAWGIGAVSWDELGGWPYRICLPNQASVPRTQRRLVQIPQYLLVASSTSSSPPPEDWRNLESVSSLSPPINCLLRDLSTAKIKRFSCLFEVQETKLMTDQIEYIYTWKKPQSLHAWWNFSSSDSMTSPESSFIMSMTGTCVEELASVMNGGSWRGRIYRGGTVISGFFASSWTLGTGRELPSAGGFVSMDLSF